MSRKGKSRRLRIGRVSEAGRIYHITLTCSERAPLFATLFAGRCVVYGMQAVSNAATTLCYVVMPDHVHWLLQLQSGADLSACAQKMKSVATRHWHRHTNCLDALWQRGFYDRALRKEDDLVSVARYIVANPVRAGLVSSVRHYSLWDAVWL